MSFRCLRSWALALLLTPSLPSGAASPLESSASRTETLPEFTVSADLLSPLRSGTLTLETLRASPQRSLDGTLRQIPGFSLFRRSDSLSAHPTAQGATLGNASPNGASRCTVLLDGVPLNDPFGGWIPWTRLPVATLSRVVLTPQGSPQTASCGPLFGTIAI
ncbi:MAG: hypothetical protein RLZZ399_2727, partial [Verrucomicrobiota bacterium]